MTVTPLVSVDRAKAQVNISAADDGSDDAELADFIAAATDIVNRRCGYTAPTTFSETVNGRVDASGRAQIVLARIPVLSVQSITPQNQGMPTYDLSALVIDGEAGVLTFSNWFSFYGPLTVAYTAGRAEVPQALQTACLLIMQWLWQTQRGSSGSSILGAGEELSGPEGGGLPYEALQLMREAPYYGTPGIA